MAVVAPADFAAFSQATGVDYPASEEEKARLTPLVLQFKAQVESEQRENRGPNILGGALVGAGLVGAGIGAAALAQHLKRQGVRPEIADEVATAAAERGRTGRLGEAFKAVAPAATKGLDRVTRSGGAISRARGEYDPQGLLQSDLGRDILNAATPEAQSALVESLAAKGDRRAEDVARLVAVRETGLPSEDYRGDAVSYNSAADALSRRGPGGVGQVSGSERYGTVTPQELQEQGGYLPQTRRTAAGMMQPGYLEPEEKDDANLVLPSGELLMRPSKDAEGNWIKVPVKVSEMKALGRYQEAMEKGNVKATYEGVIPKSALVVAERDGTGRPIRVYRDREDAITKGMYEALPGDPQVKPLSSTMKSRIVAAPGHEFVGPVSQEPTRNDPYVGADNPYDALTRMQRSSEGEGSWKTIDIPVRRRSYSEIQWDPEAEVIDKHGRVVKKGAYRPTEPQLMEGGMREPSLYRPQPGVDEPRYGSGRIVGASAFEEIPAQRYTGGIKTANVQTMHYGEAEPEIQDYSTNRVQNRVIPGDRLDYLDKVDEYVNALQSSAGLAVSPDSSEAEQLASDVQAARVGISRARQALPTRTVQSTFQQDPYILKELGAPGGRAGLRYLQREQALKNIYGRSLSRRERIDLATEEAQKAGVDPVTVLNAAHGVLTNRRKQETVQKTPGMGLGKTTEEAKARLAGTGEGDFLERVYTVLSKQERLPGSGERAAALGGDDVALAHSFINQIPGLSEMFGTNLKGLSLQEKTGVVFEAVSMAAKDYKKAIEMFPELGAKAYAGGAGTHFFEQFAKTYVRRATAMMGIEAAGGQGTQASLMTVPAGTSERLALKALNTGRSLADVIDEEIAGADSAADAFARLDARTSGVKKTEAFDDPNTNGSLLAERMWSLRAAEAPDTAMGGLKARLAARSGGTNDRPGVGKFAVALKLGTLIPDESIFPGRVGSEDVEYVRKQAIEGPFKSTIDESVITPGRQRDKDKGETMLDRARSPRARRFPVNSEINAEFKALMQEQQLLSPQDRAAREQDFTKRAQNLVAEQLEIDSRRGEIERMTGDFNTTAKDPTGRVLGPGHVLIDLGQGPTVDADARSTMATIENRPRKGEISDSAEDLDAAINLREGGGDADAMGDALDQAIDQGRSIGDSSAERLERRKLNPEAAVFSDYKSSVEPMAAGEAERTWERASRSGAMPVGAPFEGVRITPPQGKVEADLASTLSERPSAPVDAASSHRLQALIGETIRRQDEGLPPAERPLQDYVAPGEAYLKRWTANDQFQSARRPPSPVGRVLNQETLMRRNANRPFQLRGSIGLP